MRMLFREILLERFRLMIFLRKPAVWDKIRCIVSAKRTRFTTPKLDIARDLVS